MKVLWVVPHVPYPPTDGGRVRSYYLLREVARRHRVRLDCGGRSMEAEAQGHLARLCESVRCVGETLDVSAAAKWHSALSATPVGLVGRPSRFVRLFQEHLQRQPPDLVHVVGIELAECVAEAARVRPVVWDMGDCASLHYFRRAAVLANPLPRLWYWWQARACRAVERRGLQLPASILLTSPIDQAALLSGTPQPLARAYLLPNGVEATPSPARQGVADPSRLVFTGNMAYLPNEDAVYDFCRDVLPFIRRQRPEVGFDVIGKNPSTRLVRFCQTIENVAVVGFVPDVRAEIVRRSVYVCPLRIGTGIKVKVLEAMACGMPIVTTPVGVEGMPVEDGRHVLVARSPEEFAEKVLEALASADLRQRLGTQALMLVRERYSWDGIGRELERIYQETMR